MKQHFIHRQHESGQAIVLIAMVMIVLIASMGLAIDGGGIFLMYRDVQNATDAAGLSAAFELCNGDNVQAAAERSASLNGFEASKVTVEYPYDYRPGDPSINPDEYLRITITDTKPSYFIQVVYDGDLDISASTVARCVQTTSGGGVPDAGVVTLRQNCGSKESIRFRGNSDTTVIGGIYVNQTCTSRDSIKTNGTADAIVDGKVCSQGDINDSPPFQEPDGSTHGDVEERCTDYDVITDPDPLGLGTPSVSSLCPDDRGSLSSYDDGSNPAQPGNYTNFTINNGAVNLEPGIYCVGAGFSWKGDITSLGGIFIYQYSGDFNMQAQADVDIEAMTTGDYAGIQIYSLSTNLNSGNKINGGAGVQYNGTVYVPYGLCDINGGADSEFIGQIICFDVDLGGNSDTLIQWNFVPSLPPPPEFGLVE